MKATLVLPLTVAGILGLTLSASARAGEQARTRNGKLTPDVTRTDVTRTDTTKVPTTPTTIPPDTKLLPACSTLCGGAWATSGNPGGGSVFLGTTDETPLVLRTNNQDRIRIDRYDSVKVGLVNLSSVFGTLSNRQAVIHLLKGQEREATSNAYLNNPQSGVVHVNGHVAPPAGRGRLEVSGLVRSYGDGGGVMFPDGTVQTTAQQKGDAGPEGKQGPPGPPGPAGTISIYYVNADLNLPANGYAPMTAECQPGDLVLGGGYRCPDGSEKKIYIYQARPQPASGGSPAGYKMFAIDVTSQPLTCTVTAVCAHLGP